MTDLRPIAVASDHAGYHHKEAIKAYLQELGHVVEDFGTSSTERVDYPDYIRPAAQAVAAGTCRRGVIFGGSGNGEAIAANKVRGIRCAVCWSEDSGRLAREHNDANMISMGERLVPLETAKAIVKVWLESKFEGGRHVARLQKLEG